MSGQVRTDVDAMLAVRTSIAVSVDQIERALDQAQGAALSVLASIEAALAAARSRLAHATDALNACLRCEDADCSREAMEVREAQAQVEAANMALAGAKAAISRFEPARARFRREGSRLQRDAQRKIADRIGDVQAYLRAAGGGGGGRGGFGGAASTSAAGVADSGLAVALDPVPGAPDGFVMVPVDRIDQSFNPITGQHDFTKGYSPQDLAWAMDALEDVVLPAIEQGIGLDYFQQRDAQEGRFGTASYTSTYVGFFDGGEAIRLDRQSDGSYGIGNGRHRIWVAQHHGVTHIPAIVT